jgi:hypothetical protein
MDFWTFAIAAGLAYLVFEHQSRYLKALEERIAFLEARNAARTHQ